MVTWSDLKYNAEISVLIGQHWVEIDIEKYQIESISYTVGCYDGGTPGIGFFYSPSISVSMKDNSLIEKGREIKLKFKREDNNKVLIYAGQFIVSETNLSNDAETLAFSATSKLASIAEKTQGLPLREETDEAKKENIEFAKKFMLVDKKEDEIGEYIPDAKTVGDFLGYLYEKTGVQSVSERISEKDWESFKKTPLFIPVNGEQKKRIIGNGEEGYCYDLYLSNTKIKIKDLISGIAIMLGANAYEKEGNLVFVNKTGYSGNQIKIEKSDSEEITNFSNSYYSSYEISRESYGISSISIEYQPVILWDENLEEAEATAFFGADLEPTSSVSFSLFGVGANAIRDYALLPQGDNGAGIKYEQIVQCDWAGGAMRYSKSQGGLPRIYTEDRKYEQRSYEHTIASVVQGDLVFHTGKIEIPALLVGDILGTSIEFYDGEEKKSIYAGEITYTWDGGFTTEIRSSCGVDGVNRVATSGTSSSSSSSAIPSSALNDIGVTYATVDFSNALENSLPGFLLKEQTIEGWAIKDGTILGSKIENSTITGSKIAESTITNSNIEDATLTGSKFIDGTISGSKFVDGTITASKIKESTITNSLIADSTLTGAKIKDATIGFEKVNTSFISDLTASEAYVNKFKADVADINYLTADDAIIKNIQSVAISADYIKAATADIGYLTADEADIKYASVDFSNVTMETVKNLYADSGILTEATIVNGNVTGRLNGVKINADVIDAGTISTDRLLVTGEDGIVYKINVNSSGLSMSELEDPKYQKYLNGTDIVANSITASQIAVNTLTANEINAKSIAGAVGEFIEINAGQITSGYIDADRIKAGAITSDKIDIIDLSSLNATIGGFSIAENKIYSKSTTPLGGEYEITIRSDFGEGIPGIEMKYDEMTKSIFGGQFINIHDKLSSSYVSNTGISGGRFFMGAQYKDGSFGGDLKPYNGNSDAIVIDSGQLKEGSTNEFLGEGPYMKVNIPITATKTRINGNLTANGRITTVHGIYNSAPSGRFASSAIEIRENDLVGNTKTGLSYAPTIGFHWANRLAATIAFSADTGYFHFLKQDGTSDATIKAGLVTSTIKPDATDTVNIGTTDLRFKDVYANNMHLKGSGNYGSKLSFGDGDYVSIHEYADDKLRIKAKGLKYQLSNVDYDVVACTIATSGNFKYWKYADGTLKILWKTKINSPIEVNNVNSNVYVALNGGTTFPVAFTEMPSAFCSITTPDNSAPFVTMSVDGVSSTKFGRWITFADYPTTLPTGTVLSAMFIGAWK